MANDERALGATFDPATLGWFDFETRSQTATLEDGTYRYATEADAIILAWAIGDGQVKRTHVRSFSLPLMWTEMPETFRAHHERVVAGEAKWVAWNAGFDKAVWNFSTIGFPELAAEHVIDAMVQATASGFAPDLKMASRQAGGAKKDDAGKDLIKHFCLPGAKGTPQGSPVEWEAFLSYAGDDVEAMRDVFKTSRQLSLAEWREYWAMEKINERGVGIDVAMVANAARLATEDKVRSSQEIFSVTRGEVPSVDHVARMTEWLIKNLPNEGRQILLKRAEEIDDDGVITRPAKYHLTRRQIERLLAFCRKAMEDLDTSSNEMLMLIRAERILQIRLYGGSKTPAKFGKMARQQLDGVLYGQYVFGGAAQTGRASSRGVQVHNLARDTLPYEHDAIEAVLNGIDYRNFAILGDDTPASRKLALLIRPAFVARDDRMFVWSDWSQIEARILPWLVGQDGAGAELRLEVFKAVDADPTVPDIYTRTAADLSHLSIAEITKPLRQRGKVAELALGFGGGLGALQSMAAGYGMHLDDHEAQHIVKRWREANPWCVQFWHDIWHAIENALQWPDEPFTVGRVTYIYKPQLLGALFCMLPSGRLLTYRDIRNERVDVKDDDGNKVGEETQLRFARAYGRVKFWHGMAVENIVQAVAADCLRGTLRRLEDDGFAVRLHTHDEILCEVDESKAEITQVALRSVMQRGFVWSEGLPLMSEETISPYYTKNEPTEPAPPRAASVLAVDYPSGIPYEVCQLFEQLAFKAREAGKDQYSARTILEVMRWHHEIERGLREFKCNDHWSPTLSRWFMAKHPETEGFFELRALRSGTYDGDDEA